METTAKGDGQIVEIITYT